MSSLLDDPDSLSLRQQFVSFFVAGQCLGIPVADVQEVLNRQSITRTPRAREEIAGLLNLRGQIVTAVDLKHRLRLPSTQNSSDQMNVVIHNGGESFSLLVDSVGDVIEVNEDELEPVPATLDARWRTFCRGVFRLEDRLLLTLDVEAVLDLAEEENRS